MATIHNWNGPGRAFVLLSMKSFVRTALYSTDLKRIDFGITEVITDDPEWAEVCDEVAARRAEDVGKGEFYAIPYDVAARLHSLMQTIDSMRGEIGDYKALVEGASLPIEHTYEGDPKEEAKLGVEVETAEPHEGGGSMAYFTLDDKYVVVNKAWLEERLEGA